MSDLSDLPPQIPPGFCRLELAADEMDHLMRYWELRDHGEIMAWGAKLLHDLTKLDEGGWRLTLTKAEIDEATKRVQYSPRHRQVYMLMKWLGPTKDGWNRLPTPEVLDIAMKAPASTETKDLA